MCLKEENIITHHFYSQRNSSGATDQSQKPYRGAAEGGGGVITLGLEAGPLEPERGLK